MNKYEVRLELTRWNKEEKVWRFIIEAANEEEAEEKAFDRVGDELPKTYPNLNIIVNRIGVVDVFLKYGGTKAKKSVEETIAHIEKTMTNLGEMHTVLTNYNQVYTDFVHFREVVSVMDSNGQKHGRWSLKWLTDVKIQAQEAAKTGYIESLVGVYKKMWLVVGEDEEKAE